MEAGWTGAAIGLAACLATACGGGGRAGADADAADTAVEDSAAEPLDAPGEDVLDGPDGIASLPGRCPGQPDTPAPADIAEIVFVREYGGWGGYRGSPLVVSDGSAPLVVDSAFGSVTAHGVDGGEAWSNAIDGRNYGGCIRADLDGDGTDWIAAADNSGSVYVWSTDGAARAGWPFRVHLDADVRSLAAADMDGDGGDEIVVFSSLTDNPPGEPNPNMYILDGDGSVLAGWPHYRESDPYEANACIWCGGFNMNIALADVDGGGMDAVFTQDRYSVSIFHLDGTPVMTSADFSWCGDPAPLHWGEIRTYIPCTAEFSVVCDAHDQILEFTYSPPLVADIDDDTTAEVIAVPNSEEPVGTTTGSALTVFAPDRTHKPGFAPYHLSGPDVTSGAPHEVCPSAVAADFTGEHDGLEILAVHLDGTLRLYSATGEELWQVAYATSACLCTEPVVADLDGDRVPEAAVFVNCGDSEPTTLMVVDGAGDERLVQDLPFATIAAPTLTDLDADGELDVLLQAVSGASAVKHYRWPGATPDCLIWPTARGDHSHTGSLL